MPQSLSSTSGFRRKAGIPISRGGTPGAQEVHDDLAISYPAGRRAGGAANPPA